MWLLSLDTPPCEPHLVYQATNGWSRIGFPVHGPHIIYRTSRRATPQSPECFWRTLPIWNRPFCLRIWRVCQLGLYQNGKPYRLWTIKSQIPLLVYIQHVNHGEIPIEKSYLAHRNRLFSQRHQPPFMVGIFHGYVRHNRRVSKWIKKWTNSHCPSSTGLSFSNPPVGCEKPRYARLPRTWTEVPRAPDEKKPGMRNTSEVHPHIYIILHYITLHYIILYYIVSYHIILYYTILYYIISHYIYILYHIVYNNIYIYIHT